MISAILLTLLSVYLFISNMENKSLYSFETFVYTLGSYAVSIVVVVIVTMMIHEPSTHVVDHTATDVIVIDHGTWNDSFSTIRYIRKKDRVMYAIDTRDFENVNIYELPGDEYRVLRSCEKFNLSVAWWLYPNGLLNCTLTVEIPDREHGIL